MFHGDLHGGNLLVQRDGTVALLDFGITGRLDERKRLAFLRLQMGATANNLDVQVEALRDLGALPADVDVEAVIADLGLDRPPRRPHHPDRRRDGRPSSGTSPRPSSATGPACPRSSCSS